MTLPASTATNTRPVNAPHVRPLPEADVAAAVNTVCAATGVGCSDTPGPIPRAPIPVSPVTGAQTQIENQIPQIVVREMESVLKINDGDIAVLGGLMQDITDDLTTSVPFLSKLPLIGELLFTSVTKDYRKTELVIFLRPVVVHRASLAGDLADYRPFLEEMTAPVEAYSGREAGP